MLKVVRSPGKVCWHVKYGDILIETAPTKRAAEAVARKLKMLSSIGVEGMQ